MCLDWATRLPYKPAIGRMVASGVLGVWTHVLIDGTQHADMRIFWPNTAFCLASYTRPYIETIAWNLPVSCFSSALSRFMPT